MPDFHMRRKDKMVTDRDELLKPLREADYITLALSMENIPYIATLSHGFDEDNNCIYFHCAKEGKKVTYLRSNPVVWGQALLDGEYQHGSCDHLYHSTQFLGRVTFIDDLDEKRHALEVAIRQLDEAPDEIIKTQLMESSISKVLIGRIDIEEISGKRADKIIISL